MTTTSQFSTSLTVASQTKSQSSTTSTVSSPTNIGSGTKLTTRADIGIGLGCALAGALLAGFIAFILFHRKRQQRPYPQPQLLFNEAGHMEQEKYVVVTEGEVKGATPTNFERLLPQPAEDDAIIGGLSKIRDSIRTHVQSYYHTDPVSDEVVDELRLADLSQATGFPASALLRFLFNPSTRLSVIRLFLGHLILSRLQGRIDGQASFLPSEVSGLTASQSNTSASSCKFELLLCLIQTNDPDHAQPLLFSKLTTIPGVLLQQKYGEQPGDNDARVSNIAQIIAAAETVLHPFINPNIDINTRQHHLEEVIRGAAQFAFLLFSQPGSFGFDFQGRGEESSLLVFPAFLQTVSNEAKILSPPRLLSEGEVLLGREI
jgi:hypothetical protein